MGVIRRLVKWTAGLGIALLAVMVAAVLYASDSNMRHYGNGRDLALPVDAIVVLGSGVDGDGVLRYSSRRRVAAAVDLLKAGETRSLILSGGTVYTGMPPIANLMRDHAIALGAPPEALLLEPRSRTTFENLRFSFALAEQKGLQRLAIATDAFHLERAEWLAGYFGRPGIGLVAMPGLERELGVVQVRMILRETAAWWFNLGKVIAWEALADAGLDVDARQEWIR